LHSRDRQLRALERIENAEQMLPLAKNDLRSARGRALFPFFVLNQSERRIIWLLQPNPFAKL